MGHADACRARCGDAGALRLTAAYTMKSRRHCAPATILLSLMLGACAGTHGEANNGLDIELPKNKYLTPPGFYHVFAFNKAGVPSKSRMIRINPSERAPL